MLPLGILGSGNMAEAIVRAAIARNVARPSDIYASDPYAPRRELFASLGVHATDDNRVVAAKARTLLLCCKPQTMKAVLESIRGDLGIGTLVVSIAAGISTEFIRAGLGRPAQPVVRVMPNTPLMVGEGMAAVAPAEGVTQPDVDTVLSLFRIAGKVVQVKEDAIDAVTAVSGSGPAYYFLITQHLAQAAVELGLDRETAEVLARQTALGSAAMMMGSADSLEELRRKVTSPGGTTQAAIESMEKNGLPQIFRDAVAAACRRGAELRGG